MKIIRKGHNLPFFNWFETNHFPQFAVADLVGVLSIGIARKVLNFGDGVLGKGVTGVKSILFVLGVQGVESVFGVLEGHAQTTSTNKGEGCCQMSMLDTT